MIIYVATYPRSGSAVLRNLIGLNWGYLTSSDAPVAIDKMAAKFQMRGAPEPVDGFPPGLYWGDGVCVYWSRAGEWRRLLEAPGMRWLTPDVRERLAAERNKFFVKTHNMPFEVYLPGESAIQMVRHPGAAIVSLWKLERDFFRQKKALTAYVKGQAVGGSWSTYHDRWSEAGLPMLRLSYEEAFADQRPAVAKMAEFLGEPVLGAIRVIPLEESNRQNPVRNPGAGLDGWRASVSAEDLALLEEAHGTVSQCFGYSFSHSAPKTLR